MKLLNRVAIRVTPLKGYADWVSQLSVSIMELETPPSLAEHQAESRIYLVAESDESLETILASNNLWEEILKNELGAWDEFEDHWPTVTQQRFNEWFDVALLPVVFDQETGPLMRAELS